MNLNGPKIQKISDLQFKHSIENNKLFLLALSIDTGKATVVKSIIEELKINPEEVTLIVDILSKENLLSKNDLKLISKLSGTKLLEKEDLDHMVEEVISHLNAITHTKRRVTEQRKSLIVRWLKKGYSIEDFISVNLLFYYKWHKNPDMEQYIRPETLYNNKFEIRVEEAQKEFELINKYKEEIYDICKTYNYFFENLIVTPSLKYKTEIEFLDSTKDFCKYMPFDLQQRIAFWLNKGFSKEDIMITIEKTIIQWSQKVELYPHINLMKILDRKFPERVSVAKKIIEKEPEQFRNKNITSLEEWAKE